MLQISCKCFSCSASKAGINTWDKAKKQVHEMKYKLLAKVKIGEK